MREIKLIINCKISEIMCSDLRRRTPVKRTMSSSVVEEARTVRERLFRLRSDRPLHRPRDQGLQELGWNCSGFPSWASVLLSLILIKMFLENINKTGVRIKPSLWINAAFGQIQPSREYPVLTLLLYINLPLIVALKTELGLAQEKISWKNALSIHIANLLSLLIFPVLYINHKCSISFINALILCAMYSCLFMKLVSYVQVNKWCRDAVIKTNKSVKCETPSFPIVLYENLHWLAPGAYTVYVDLLIRKPSALTNVPAADTNGLRRRRFYSISPDSISPAGDVKPSGSDLDNVKHNPGSPSPLQSSLSPAALDLSQELSEMKNKLASQERKDVIYPDNLNIRDIYYFWFAPTLCYEINFPRTRRFRLSFLVNRVLEMIFGLIICLSIFQQYLIPSALKALIPFSKMDQNVPLALERILKLAIPNHLMWLISFYILFHSFLNILAEILQFADRSFFQCWWNATNLEMFWKNWNLPVHRWCLRHVYKPLLCSGFSKVTSILAVFFVSAFFHEYLASVPLRMFKVSLGLGMLVQVPIIFFSRIVEKKCGPRISNMMMWFCLIIGHSVIIMTYFHDFVVLHYGRDHIESFGKLQI
ncbi:diacylglycerol O-acyltransferase 1 isoform X2 [Eurytemora carolleeae]|uniref:diacylglycerol O-acyltransferase 1 isoform X2 n=1 Tax=Eurytemora carolleeae TaxID=1294199 RepID=UPI000C7666EA|nr:diacylglycerol O-acyltransferase 1 isoform X2 [Eurytemora carolleeae]|eukprot:XP_023325908.1 diacylglycerol O-acyltransferase 1-like isoform X2 [Eurytemora affinis]